MPKIGVVVTTIGDGNFLREYCRQIEEEQLKDSVTIYIIPDLKTPKMLRTNVTDYRSKGFDVRCASFDEQEALISYVGLANMVPYNSDNRRNVGYLQAYQDKNEIIISIDDDNYCRKGSKYFLSHSNVGQAVSIRSREVISKWYNVCADIGIPKVYPRGYPYRFRNDRRNGFKEEVVNQKVMMNVGLWLGDPDLDALTWVQGGAKAHVFTGTSFLLGKGTWTPISSQNTAFHRDVTVAYYFLPMNTTVRGLEMDRYGDIFSGYFAQACTKHMGDGIRVGTPIVEHVRNGHDHWSDVRKELVCIGMIEDIMDWLINVTLVGTTYSEVYLSLANQLEDVVEKFAGTVWTVDAKAYFHRAVYCMRRWVKACEKLQS